MVCVAKFLRILTGTVNTDPEVSDPGIADCTKRQARVFLNVSLGDKVRRNSSLVRAKILGDRLEPCALTCSKRLIGPEFPPWRDCTLGKIGRRG